MLQITEDDAHNCFVLEPSGKLRSEDFDALTARFNARVGATDRVPNIVIHAPDFPGWADFGALVDHIRFVREHHRMIEKVALVSDARFLDIAPTIARHFVRAEIRHFPADSLEAALSWVGEPARHTSHVTVMQDLPPDTVGISVRGVVTASDYDETIVPLIEAKLKDHPKLKLIYRIGPEFEAFTAGAVWSDTRVGMMHLTDFAKIAVVSDVNWIRHAVRAFAPLIPGQVHVFAERQLSEAKAWIAA
jgi:hypothetical protein